MTWEEARAEFLKRHIPGTADICICSKHRDSLEGEIHEDYEILPMSAVAEKVSGDDAEE